MTGATGSSGFTRAKSRDAITAELINPVADYGLRKEDFLAIIEGMEADAFKPHPGT